MPRKKEPSPPREPFRVEHPFLRVDEKGKPVLRSVEGLEYLPAEKIRALQHILAGRPVKNVGKYITKDVIAGELVRLALNFLVTPNYRMGALHQLQLMYGLEKFETTDEGEVIEEFSLDPVEESSLATNGGQESPEEDLEPGDDTDEVVLKDGERGGGDAEIGTG